ncbi:ATP-binding protein [Halorientalis brevis]|uniref:ATP-binding protein n=1 Tax=Halorientalis brevis TaxID=1126241 RepID=A0ABD6CBA1_9EURY|nr:ATP-binding protein [Halorientalis brevis]
MTADVDTERTVRETVAQDGDEVLVRKAAEDVATDVGFDETGAAEVGIVAAELSTNVLKHAGTGEVTIEHVTDDDRDGVRIESLDAGPGIDDVDAAFADGASTVGTLGRGLGAVNRLMDQVTVAAPGEPDYGTHVVADRWLRPTYEATTPCPLGFGAASRPKSPGTSNGDSFIIKRWNDTALVGVIDGLGHGPKAHDAAIAAKGYVERHYDRSMESIFTGTERACRGTRGVVMALARFDWAAESVTFASVGNINCKVDGPADLSIVPRRGVLGSNGPDPVVTTSSWTPDSRMVLFSDGMVSHWDWAEYDALFQEPATVTARKLLAQLGKDHDDATVVVATAGPDEPVPES